MVSRGVFFAKEKKTAGREREKQITRKTEKKKNTSFICPSSKTTFMKIQTKRTAATNPQFATGPQKCVVFGPVGEFTQRANAEDIIFCCFLYPGPIKKCRSSKKKAVREFDFLRVSRVDFSLSPPEHKT